MSGTSDGWVTAAFVDELADGDAIAGQAGVIEVALYKLGDAIYATDMFCTHGQARLSDGFVEDGCIECPLHQGRFDIATGKALSLPVTADIKTYPVRIVGDEVQIRLL